MAKTLTINYGGTTYTLQYTRKSIERLEKRGFTLSDISDKPMTVLPEFFRGAFLANHPFVKTEIVDEIFEHLTNKNELIEKLAEMYNEPLSALMDEPEPNAEGNALWEANF